MAHTNRIVVLVDMDCFFCQVEEQINPRLKGKPVAVVQYNEWRGGGIIAVNYPARDRGVTRHMRGNEAKKICPDIQLVKVPQMRGKADTSKYRDAGKRVADVLQTFTPLLERASVDEAYLDITQEVEKRVQEHCQVTVDKLKNTFVVGSETADFVDNLKHARIFDEDLFKLAVGGMIAEEIREAVFQRTGYRCSAGIAHNKILAKLVCGLHKPNKQTLLPHRAVPQLYENMPLKKITSLGGKFGATLSKVLRINNMGELVRFTEKELCGLFDNKTGHWLYNIARGIDLEPVTVRLIPKSIGCGKNFPGKGALFTEGAVEHWLGELADELSGRLQKDSSENNRRAKLLSVNYSQIVKSNNVASTRSCPFGSYDRQKLAAKAVDIVKKNCRKEDGSYHVTHLGLNMTNFEDTKNVREITSFFKNAGVDHKNSSCSTEEDDVDRNLLVYYEDVNPESILDQSFPSENPSNVSASSTDSISPEIFHNETEPVAEIERPPSTSFFHNYFSENLKRDFDTSKVIDTDSEDLETSSETASSTRICEECGKQVDLSELQCHMDYHFALNMVKSEAHIYKTPSSEKTLSNHVVKSKSTKMGKKRKKSPEIGARPLSAYFKTSAEPPDSARNELCLECNKRFESKEFSDHMDYHAAKKLHLELNSGPGPAKSKRNLTGGQSILNFLKKS